MVSYLPRSLEGLVEKWMNKRYMVILKGARQVGKTTLLKHLHSKYGGTYIDFTDEDWALKFSQDPLSFSKFPEPLFLDEISMVKNAGRSLKLLYDHKKMKIVVSGSGAFEVKENISGYLVGRSITLTLYPLSFEEFLSWKNPNLHDWYLKTKHKIWDYLSHKRKSFSEIPEIPKLDLYYSEYLKYGGYPSVVLANEDQPYILRNIVNSQLEKDIFQFFDVREKDKFRGFLKYLSSNVGGLFNAHSTGLSNNTAWNYASILELEYILKLLPPFHKNLSTELRKSKKIYFYDLGIARILSENRLSVGQENENFIFSQLISRFPEEQLRYWRTQGGAEVDFVILRNGEPFIPIEVKSSNKRSRSLLSLLNSYNLDRGIIISNFHKLKGGTREILYLEPWWV